MNRQLAGAVVEFVAAPRAEGADNLKHFRPRHWRSSLHWLVTSGLALHLFQDLGRASRFNVLPQDIHDGLAEMWSASEARVQSLEASLVDLNARFSNAGLRFANWKGFATVPDFCPDTRVRPASDFDFFIDPAQVPEFHAILTGCGYYKVDEREDEIRYENLPGSLIPFQRTYHASPSRRVELHTGLNVNVAHRGFRTDAALLERRIVRQFCGVSFSVLAPADAFVLHALHITKHFLDGWVRLAWLLELRHFIEAHRSHDALWQDVQSRAESNAGSSLLVGIAIWLARCVFPFDPRCVDWAIQALPVPVGAWLDQFGRSSVLADFPGTKLPVLLARELLDDASWKQLQRARLLPMNKPPTIANQQHGSLGDRIVGITWQMKFLWMRTRFHAVEGARYLIEKRRWDRRQGEIPAQHTSLIS